jgi:error-prone DNA polymerase
MLTNGYPQDFAEAIFAQIEGFGEYGFPESHAASFALLAYVSAWVKCHHPDVFLAALLNSQPMGFYSPSQLVQDARRHAVEVWPVDVLASEWDCTLGAGFGGVVSRAAPVVGEVSSCAALASGDVFSHAAPSRGGPPSAYCEQKLSGGPPLARADLAGAASEGQSQSQSHGQTPPLAGESAPAFGASAPTRSAAGRSGVGGGDFCSQHEEPPTPDRYATTEGSPGEANLSRPLDQCAPHQAVPDEASTATSAKTHQLPTTQPVRLGLRLVSGLGESAGRRIVAARLQLHSQGQAFSNVAQLAHLAQLNQAELDALAAADALQSLAGHRHTQVWAAAGAVPLQGLFRPVGAADDPLQPDLLPPPTLAQDVVGDYAATGLSLRAHPLQFLRAQLAAQRLSTAAELASYPSGRLARACGIVTVRQQPGTASGVVFVTLEDETGTVNVIVWRALRERQRHELTRSRLLAVYGVWQRDDDTGGQVRHLVARRLKDLTPLLGQLHTSSRDFH